MSERNFLEQTPFTTAKEAAQVVLKMIRDVGDPGHIWYTPAIDRVRLCAPDYVGADGEVFVGVYTSKARLDQLAKDLSEARGDAGVREKWTRSVTVTETVETAKITKNIPAFIPAEPEPVSEIRELEQIQEVGEPLAEPERLPAVPPAPALPAPAKDDAYGAAVWSLVAERNKIDARIAELQLLRFLFDRKASDRLAFFLEDYCEFLESAFDCVDAPEEELLRGHYQEAQEWAKRFALQQANERSIFTRTAHYLATLAAINEDCGANDESEQGKQYRAEAAEMRELVAILQFAAIKPSEVPPMNSQEKP